MIMRYIKVIFDTIQQHYWSVLLIVAVISAYLMHYLKAIFDTIQHYWSVSLIIAVIGPYLVHYLKDKERAKTRRFELAYEAILKALQIIDCQLSHNVASDVPPDKQYVSTDEVRLCHNQLLLSCKNNELIQLFIQIMLPDEYTVKTLSNIPVKSNFYGVEKEVIKYNKKIYYRHPKTNDILSLENYIDIIDIIKDKVQLSSKLNGDLIIWKLGLLNEFRTLARKELSFSGCLRMDEKKSWFGTTLLCLKKEL